MRTAHRAVRIERGQERLHRPARQGEPVAFAGWVPGALGQTTRLRGLAGYTGTAGGLVDNTTETATFDAASFSVTGAKLTALSASIE